VALFLAMAFAALFVSGPILAHHGETNYDTDNLVSMKATVTSFQFINPHVQIFLDVTNVKGEVQKWRENSALEEGRALERQGTAGSIETCRGAIPGTVIPSEARDLVSSRIGG